LKKTDYFEATVHHVHYTPKDALRRGTPVELASRVDEHTCESLLDITEKTITSEKLIDPVWKIIAKGVAPPIAAPR
jgi:hypothetical protein